MLLVLFTFNVTETENASEQPFISRPENARLMHHFPLFGLHPSPRCLTLPPFVSSSLLSLETLSAFLPRIPPVCLAPGGDVGCHRLSRKRLEGIFRRVRTSWWTQPGWGARSQHEWACACVEPASLPPLTVLHFLLWPGKPTRTDPRFSRSLRVHLTPQLSLLLNLEGAKRGRQTALTRIEDRLRRPRGQGRALAG